MPAAALPTSAGRRTLLRSGAAGLLALLGTGCATRQATADPGLPAFTSVPLAFGDEVAVPPGYTVQVLYPWGTPTGIVDHMPAWRPDAGNSAEEQAVQAGMHHDGMHFFPLDAGGTRGLLALNHEYTDESLLHTVRLREGTPESVRKSQHALGVSILEVALRGGRWEQVLPSPYARRIHARTPMRIAGPAAGHPALRTTFDPAGTSVLGTIQNCAMGVTPWGTYLTCEENVHGHFGAPRGSFAPSADQRRYGLGPDNAWVPWWRHDERFDLSRHPNEAHRFGWVVEIDPHDAASTPVKRTALGRLRHESATCTRTRDGRVAVYLGDDAAFECIYKFVSRDAVRPGGYAANRELLDHGTLYAARFDADGRGRWIGLAPGRNGLAAAQGFGDAGDVCIRTRQAAAAVGATPMDRPEWVAVEPGTGTVYVTLTNNGLRGAPGRPPTDAANPRAANVFGHIVRWDEDAGDAAATAFTWESFVLPGDPAVEGAGTRYPSADADVFGAPDGLHFDAGGLLWIQTDGGEDAARPGAWARLGNNALLCANPATGAIRRFLTGPRGCELTGCVLTPDRRTLFVNVQHPGERVAAAGRVAWPDGTRPRSATLAVRREDGGVVGS